MTDSVIVVTFGDLCETIFSFERTDHRKSCGHPTVQFVLSSNQDNSGRHTVSIHFNSVEEVAGSPPTHRVDVTC